MKDIKLFHSNQIRTVWNDEAGEWYFSVVDVVGALSESSNPNNYWKVLKNRLKKEGNETVTNCNRLKLMAADGKMRLTDVANTEDILRIIQSIPSPKAEPFKQWLAQLGADRINDIQAAEALNQEIDARIAARNSDKINKNRGKNLGSLYLCSIFTELISVVTTYYIGLISSVDNP